MSRGSRLHMVCGVRRHIQDKEYSFSPRGCRILGQASKKKYRDASLHIILSVALLSVFLFRLYSFKPLLKFQIQLSGFKNHFYVRQVTYPSSYPLRDRIAGYLDLDLSADRSRIGSDTWIPGNLDRQIIPIINIIKRFIFFCLFVRISDGRDSILISTSITNSHEQLPIDNHVF